MDTTNQIRQINFNLLFDQFKEQNSELPNRGMLKLFAEKLDLSERYLSHIKCARKNIGANIARQIEKQLKLQQGWMDNRHDESKGTCNLYVADEFERKFLEIMLEIYRSSPDKAHSMMLEALKQRLNEPQVSSVRKSLKNVTSSEVARNNFLGKSS